MDWCDAYSYCEGVGKRLCGRIGGGSNGYEDYDDPAQSQWLNACSGGGAYDYPYGDIYQLNACKVAGTGPEDTVPVKSKPDCRTQDGVYDLSGNVWEWEDSCHGTIGKYPRCRLRGGGFYNSYLYGYLMCASDGYERIWDNDIGFRCCSR